MTVRWGTRWLCLCIALVCFVLWFFFFPWGWRVLTHSPEIESRAAEYTPETSPAGMGPDYPEIFVTEDYLVYEKCPVSQGTKVQVDKLLAELWADHISQSFVMCMPNEDFANAGIWANRFARFNGVGEVAGVRAHNGFVWLVLYDQEQRVTSVHYSVGDGLPAITAGELDPIMREAKELSSMDDVVNVLGSGFHDLARAKYQPHEPDGVYYGGPIEEESDGTLELMCLLWALLISVGLILITEPFLGLYVFLTGSAEGVLWMAWPLRLIAAMAENSGGSSSSTDGGYSSGSGSIGRSDSKSSRSFGGSTRSRRSR